MVLLLGAAKRSMSNQNEINCSQLRIKKSMYINSLTAKILSSGCAVWRLCYFADIFEHYSFNFKGKLCKMKIILHCLQNINRITLPYIVQHRQTCLFN